jgi:hypothetical protein
MLEIQINLEMADFHDLLQQQQQQLMVLQMNLKIVIGLSLADENCRCCWSRCSP